MKKQYFIDFSLSLIVFLFLYASISKLVDFKIFNASMDRQPLPGWSKPILVWAVPLSEIIVCVCLLYENIIGYFANRFHSKYVSPPFAIKIRLAGLYGALLLMSLFTTYTALAVLKTFNKIPCSCGGVIQHLTWRQHLLLNIFFTLLTIVAISLTKRKSPSEIRLNEHTING